MKKLKFVQKELPELFKTLDPEDKGAWGVLSAQGMVEHMSDSVREATGKVQLTVMAPEERWEKLKMFVLSDKPFKENTKNAKMPDEPSPLRHESISDAIVEYNKEVEDFILHFKGRENATLPNTFFGHLNFEEWTALFYKHGLHHCKQFGVK